MAISWITENLSEFWTDQVSGTIKVFGKYIDNIFFTIVELGTSNEYVQSANTFIVIFSLAAIAMLVGKMVLDTDVMETAYDSDEEPINLLVRIAETVAVISCSGAIFDYLFKFSKAFASDLLGSSNAMGVADTTNGLLNVDTVNLGVEAFIYLVIINFLVIGFLVFSVISGLRGAELIAMKLFMPLFALDLLTNSRERWNNFFMGYILAFISYGFQTLFFILAMKSYASASISSMDYALSAVVWIIIAISGPHFLEKYIYKTGMSRAVGSGLRMVAQTAMLKGAKAAK